MVLEAGRSRSSYTLHLARLASSEAPVLDLQMASPHPQLPLHMALPLCTPRASICARMSSSYKDTNQTEVGP